MTTSISTCIADGSYFATPDFLHITAHIMTAIGTPIHVFGAWVILFRTPGSMASVKWPLLNLHFWSSLFDTILCLLSTPVALFPAIAMYFMGALTYFGVPDWLQCHILLTAVGIVIVAMITVYENRYFMVTFVAKTGFWARWRCYFLTGAYFIGATFLIPFTATIPNQNLVLEYVFQRIPCLTIPKDRIFVYTFNLSLAFFVCLFLLITAFLIIGIFIFLTIRNLLKNTKNGWQSKKTLRLQKKFLFCLVVQTSVPVVVVLSPISYLGFSIVKNYYNQAYNNFTVLLFSSHGLFSTVAMLLIHQPYRAATLEVLRSFTKRSRVAHIQ